MEHLNSVKDLKNAIQLLEVEHDRKGELFKKQVMITYESLKPANLIRNTIKDLFSTSFQGENISGIAAGMTGGFLLRKLFVGRSGSSFKKVLGSIIQYGVTNLIAQNADLIKSFIPAFIKIFSGRRNKAGNH